MRLADLANERFVAFSRDMNPWTRALLERRCLECGFTLQVAQESNSPMSMEGFVAAGTGICILPAWVASGRKGVARRPLEEGELPIDLATITLRGQDSPVLRKLREALLAALRESIGEVEKRCVARLRNTRKTECGAIGSSQGIAVRDASVALPHGRGSVTVCGELERKRS